MVEKFKKEVVILNIVKNLLQKTGLHYTNRPYTVAKKILHYVQNDSQESVFLIMNMISFEH